MNMATHAYGGAPITGTGVPPPIPRKYGDPVGPTPVSPRPRKPRPRKPPYRRDTPLTGGGDPRNFAVKCATAAAAPPRVMVMGVVAEGGGAVGITKRIKQ